MARENTPLTSDQIARIEQTVLTLPARTRTIFLLHRLDGLSYAEIADHCGISVKGVEQHIARAMLEIDRALEVRRPWWRRWLDRRR